MNQPRFKFNTLEFKHENLQLEQRIANVNESIQKIRAAQDLYGINVVDIDEWSRLDKAYAELRDCVGYLYYDVLNID